MCIQIVRDFFELTFKVKKPDAAAQLYLHQDYVHYDLNHTQTRHEFVEHFTLFFEKNPTFQAEIIMEVEGNDMVVLMVKTPTQTVAEFYQMQDLRIWRHRHVREERL